MVSIVSRSPDETRRLGEWLGWRLRPGDFVALSGDLGAGKTQLTGGILAGLGIEQTGGSPTFTLLWEYQAAEHPVYHWDLYRIATLQELDDLGYEEYFYGDGINVVEWAEKILPLWPEHHLQIDLSYGEGEADRELLFSGTARFTPLLKELRHASFGH